MTAKLEQNRRQAERMVKDFIEARKGHIVNARSIACEMYEVWGVIIDWHDVSAVLDTMSAHQGVEFHNHTSDGLCCYMVM